MIPQPPYLNLEYFYYWLYRLLTSPQDWRIPSWVTLVWLVILFILWCFILIVAYKIIKMRKAESRDLKKILAETNQVKPDHNPHWEKVLKYLESENEAEWKLAVIEADNMLDELVKTLRPLGENLGERLKLIEPADFETLNDAWEAHKVRNQIAHESSFVLTKREALRVIGLFRRVFEEFDYL